MIATMRLGTSLLGMLLVLLQMLGPFLHAHSQGLVVSPGLHVHDVQGGYVADIHFAHAAHAAPATGKACLKAGDTDHWILGMPASNRPGEMSGGLPAGAGVLGAAPVFPSAHVRCAGSLMLAALDPPGWPSNDSLPPPALAPPSI